MKVSEKAKGHIREARLNFHRYESTVEDDPDLAVTELFWSALHLIQAHAVQAKERNLRFIPPRDHKDRAYYVDTELGSISVAYRMLRTASEDARYDLVKTSTAIVKNLCEVHFESIKRYLETRGIPWAAD
jgi:hypothetical protein